MDERILFESPVKMPETARLAPPREHLTFARGLKALFSSAAYLLTRPKYLGLCAAPWIINLIVLGPALYFAMRYWIYPAIIGLLPEGIGWWQEALRWSIGFPLAMMLTGFSLLIYILAAMLLGAPFHDKAGEYIERERLASRPELIAPQVPFWPGVRHALFEAMKRILIGTPFLLAGFLLACIPFIGPLLAIIWNWTFAALFLTLDAFSMPMDRRHIPMRGKWQWTTRNYTFALGFGLPMLLMPCAIFIMPPLAAVAATMIYTDILKGGKTD